MGFMIPPVFGLLPDAHPSKRLTAYAVATSSLLPLRQMFKALDLKAFRSVFLLGGAAHPRVRAITE